MQYGKFALHPIAIMGRRGPVIPCLVVASLILVFLNLWAQDLVQTRFPGKSVYFLSRKLPRIKNKQMDVERDGRVYVYPGDDHPIPKLMSEAKVKWAELKKRQSKTFREAVDEYKRRYGRLPPKGFDQWYAFAKAHNVLLIDEFDLINSNLEVFHAFSPRSFRKRVSQAQKTLETQWTIRIQNGTAIRGGALGGKDRAKGAVRLMERFVHLLPDMKLVFNGHDHARIPIVWEERKRLEHLAHNNLKDYSSAPFTPTERGPPPHHSMPIYCPSDSIVRSQGFKYEWAPLDDTGYEMPSLPNKTLGSFIGDFKKYMDVCNSPQYRHYHTTTSYVYEQHPEAITPIFSTGVQNWFADIYTIIPEQVETRRNVHIHDPKWEERPFEMLQWRGQASGPLWVKGTPWKLTQRSRLHLLTHQETGKKRILVEGKGGKVAPTHVPNYKVNPMYFDTGMVGPAVQCVDEDGTCDEMNKTFNGYDPRMSFDRQSLYKYVLDVDGNSWSGRFRRLMMSNAAVVKATIFPEFWTDWAIPWLHFIPMQVDYSDMWDIMAFFRGDIRGAGAHDALGKEIAKAGKEWVKNHYRWADLEAYQFRLMLEYARLYTDDPKSGSRNFIDDASVEPTWDWEVLL